MRARSRSLALITTAVLAVTMVGAAPTASAGPDPDHWPTEIDLPNGWQPEGIAIGPGKRAWFGSRVDGDIYQVDLKTGEGEVISQGPGTPATGLKSDRGKRLFVAGASSGTARVVSTSTGETLATYQLGTPGSTFVNDVVLTRKAAWFTDSQAAVLYKLPIGKAHALPAPEDVETLPLTGEWSQPAGFGANGITRTPDHQAFLVAHSTLGQLFRVDAATGEAVGVDLGGASVSNGDGLLTKGNRVYVVRNQLNRVDVFELVPDGASGEFVRTISSQAFDVPTTVARFGSRLYLPNARFNTTPTPSTTYTAVQVPANAEE
jgi:sugar lactone lactonase YvrE